MKGLFNLLLGHTMLIHPPQRILQLLQIDQQFLSDIEFRLATLVTGVLNDSSIDFLFLVEQEQSIHAEAIGLNGTTRFTTAEMNIQGFDINNVLKKLELLKLIEVKAIEDKGDLKIYKIR